MDGDALARAVRERRAALGLSVRALATRAGISAAYVAAIEAARNPSTGRPPVLSVPVATRLAAALDMDVRALLGGDAAHAGTHVLAFVDATPPGGLLAAIDALAGDGVDHWLHIADPRTRDADDPTRATTRRFALGTYPYATPVLDPAALLDAVEREVAALAADHRGRRVGLLIADCSAVMRYLADASTEVALESRWHDAIGAIWERHLGGPVAADVCAYGRADLAALGLTIDQLATALDLVAHHDRVLLLDGPRTWTGAGAIRRILDGARPPGASEGAWRQLVTAAAATLAGAS